MQKIRKIREIITGNPVTEGAGVKLHRVFGYYEEPKFDPFLLLDDFGSDNPDDYLAGFPWHPHRGIETVTYMLNGVVEHGDSMGNSGVIRSGDVQWMTAGNGIVHQEMPKRVQGQMRGFQLWVNLPATHKMMDPRYRDVKKDQIPELSPAPGVHMKIIAGQMNGVQGPVRDLVVKTEYYDIHIEADTEYTMKVNENYTVFAYVADGSGYFDVDDKLIHTGQVVILENGNAVKVRTKNDAVHFLFVSGKPLNEPIAWKGPIVMNTDEELRVAFQEYHAGTFIKS